MRRQGPKFVIGYAAIAAAVLSVAVLAGCSSAPADMTVHGTVEVAVQDYSEFQEYYAQVYAGNAQVTVTNPSGTVIGATTANGSNVKQGPSAEGDLTLTYGFTVTVPQGLSSYGITVTDGGSTPVQFTQQQMQHGPAVCMGDACNSGGL